jgi:hypothetical protein
MVFADFSAAEAQNELRQRGIYVLADNLDMQVLKPLAKGTNEPAQPKERTAGPIA